MMNSLQQNAIKQAIKFWADKHPNPSGVVLQTAGGRNYTPKQIAEEVDSETEFGKLQMRVIEYALKEHTLEEVLQGFLGGGKA